MCPGQFSLPSLRGRLIERCPAWLELKRCPMILGTNSLPAQDLEAAGEHFTRKSHAELCDGDAGGFTVCLITYTGFRNTSTPFLFPLNSFCISSSLPILSLSLSLSLPMSCPLIQLSVWQCQPQNAFCAFLR